MNDKGKIKNQIEYVEFVSGLIVKADKKYGTFYEVFVKF